MDEVQAQDVPTIAKPVLTSDDQKRIRNCDFYLKSKEIIQSTVDYKEYEVGSAVFIKRKETGKLVAHDYDGLQPEKYIIIENDCGFLFAKRVNANGKPGVAITCLTIDFASKWYELQVDDAYVESMLLDTQEQYDPTADAKNLAKKKVKASRDNAKIRVLFDNNADAYAYLKTLQVGDKFYESSMSYGGSITEYKVDTIEKRPAVAGTGSGWNRSRGDDDYIDNGFAEVVKVRLVVVTSTSKYSYNKDLEFKRLSRKEFYRDFLYRVRPYTTDDMK